MVIIINDDPLDDGRPCSDDCNELATWASEQTGHEPTSCNLCEPTSSDSPATIAPRHSDGHLTKLETDIVSAVVESAVIHLDNELDFEMTVGDVADYVGKTPAQISTALRQLGANDMVVLDTELSNGKPVSPKVRVFPTAQSLCTVPAFQELTEDELHHELDTLRG
jgi:hypothetical protein